MPGLNRRGPEGEGPKTGRAMGRCSGNAQEVQDLPNTSSAITESNAQGFGNRAGSRKGEHRGGGRGFGGRKRCRNTNAGRHGRGFGFGAFQAGVDSDSTK